MLQYDQKPCLGEFKGQKPKCQENQQNSKFNGVFNVKQHNRAC